MELQGISSHWKLGRGGPQTDIESPPKKMERSNPTERVSGSQRSITLVKAQISLGGISSDNEFLAMTNFTMANRKPDGVPGGPQTATTNPKKEGGPLANLDFKDSNLLSNPSISLATISGGQRSPSKDRDAVAHKVSRAVHQQHVDPCGVVTA